MLNKEHNKNGFELSTNSKNTLSAAIFLLPQTIGLLVFVLFPIVFSLIISFYDWEMLSTPSFVGLQNFKDLFQDATFIEVLKNTFFYVVTYLPLNIIVSMLFALWLTSSKIKGVSFFQSVFFFPILISTVAVSLVWKWLYQPQGLITYALSLIGIKGPNWFSDPAWAMLGIVFMSVWKYFGYNLVILVAAIKEIPTELYEAAKMDNSGLWRTFWNVTLPLISPALFFCIIMTMISSFQVFDQAFIMTAGGPGNATNTVVMYIYQNGFMFFKMGYASAVAWILFVIVVILTTIQMKAQNKWVHYE